MMSRQQIFQFVIPASFLAALAAMSACTLEQPLDDTSDIDQELWGGSSSITTYIAMGDSNVVGLGHSTCVLGQEPGTCQGYAQKTRSYLASRTAGLQALETAMIGATSQHVLDVQLPQVVSFVQGKKNLFGSNVAVVLSLGGNNLLEFIDSPAFAPCLRADFFSRMECEGALAGVVGEISGDIGALLGEIRSQVGLSTKIYIVNQPNPYETNYCVQPGMEFMPEIADAALNGSTMFPHMGLNQAIAFHASLLGARVIDAVPSYRATIADWEINGPSAGLPTPDCFHYNDKVHADVAKAITAGL